MRRERRKPRSLLLPEINLVPLIDTSLTLLVIFMVTAPMLQHGIKVDLPEGKMQEVKTAQQEYVVFIDKKEHIFVNDKQVTEETLIPALKKLLRGSQKQTVFVKADRANNYGKVLKVVDQIKYVGGIEYVALATTRHA